MALEMRSSDRSSMHCIASPAGHYVALFDFDSGSSKHTSQKSIDSSFPFKKSTTWAPLNNLLRSAQGWTKNPADEMSPYKQLECIYTKHTLQFSMLLSSHNGMISFWLFANNYTVATNYHKGC